MGVTWWRNGTSDEQRHRPNELYKLQIEDSQSVDSTDKDAWSGSGSDNWETASEDELSGTHEDNNDLSGTHEDNNDVRDRSLTTSVENIDFEELNNADNLIHDQRLNNDDIKEGNFQHTLLHVGCVRPYEKH